MESQRVNIFLGLDILRYISKLIELNENRLFLKIIEYICFDLNLIEHYILFKQK